MHSFTVLIYGLSLLAIVVQIRQFHREHDISLGLPQFLLAYVLFGSSIISLVFGIYIIGPLLGFGALFVNVFTNGPKYLKALRQTCSRNRSFVLLLVVTLGVALIWSLFSQNAQQCQPDLRWIQQHGAIVFFHGVRLCFYLSMTRR